MKWPVIIIGLLSFIAGGAAVAFWSGTAGDPSLSEEETRVLAVLPTVVPDTVKPANTMFELLPSSGSITQVSGGFRDAPPWLERNERSVTYLSGMVTTHIRNLSSQTLKRPYWSVKASALVGASWVRGHQATMAGVQVPPGETDDFGAALSAALPPGTKAVRFTVTYNEPGLSPVSATVEYPW